MKHSQWAVVTFFVVILTAASMVWMGWLGSSRHGRASAAAPRTQATAQARTTDNLDSEAAWRYRRNQTPNWKAAMCYHP